MADKTVDEIKEAFRADKEAWSYIYARAEDDLYFLTDEPYCQWDERAARKREAEGRPVITIDNTSQFVHQVVNDIRQNTPTINVIPHSSGAREETASVIKGLIKNIEYRSNADAIYDAAADFSVKCGIGWMRVDHDYESEASFEQELLIKPIHNPTAVYLDCNSMLPDGSDAMHGTALERMSAKDFKKRWPKFDPVSFDSMPERDGKESAEIVVAEHFYIHEEEKNIGIRVEIDEQGQEREVIEEVVDGVEYANERRVTKRKVKRVFVSGEDILEETDSPGRYIPLIPVYGEMHWARGKRYVFSLIRKSHDAQKMINFWKSVETEILMNSPKYGFVAAVGQTENFAQDYIQADKSVVKRYNPTDTKGNPLPPPQQIMPPPMPVGIVNAGRAAMDDLKSSMGMYQASLGMRSNETSGVAITARKAEGDNSTYHFADNLSRSIQHVGRVLISSMRQIYDTERVLRIIGEEEKIESIGVNGVMVDGQELPHDITSGEYDVRVVTGASYATKRQEAAALFESLLTRNPALLQTIGDLAFKHMDVPGAQAISERFAKLLPPELQDKEDEEASPEMIQAGQMIEQSQAAIAELTQRLQQAEAQLESKQAEQEIKVQSENNKADAERAKIEVELMRLELEREKTRLETALKEQELEIKRGELALKATSAVVSDVAVVSGNQADTII